MISVFALIYSNLNRLLTSERLENCGRQTSPKGEGGVPYEKDGVAIRTVKGLLALRLFRLNRTTGGTFALSFRVLSRKQKLQKMKCYDRIRTS